MSVIDSPSTILKYRMFVLKQGLKLELKGLKRRGRSFYSIIKEEFNLKGSKQKVYEQFERLLNDV